MAHLREQAGIVVVLGESICLTEKPSAGLWLLNMGCILAFLAVREEDMHVSNQGINVAGQKSRSSLWILKERVSPAFTHTHKQGWGVYRAAHIFFSLLDTPCVWPIVWLQVLINKSWHSIETSYSPAVQDGKPKLGPKFLGCVCCVLGTSPQQRWQLIVYGELTGHTLVCPCSPLHCLALWQSQLEAEKWSLPASRGGRSGTIWQRGKSGAVGSSLVVENQSGS